MPFPHSWPCPPQPNRSHFYFTSSHIKGPLQTYSAEASLCRLGVFQAIMRVAPKFQSWVGGAAWARWGMLRRPRAASYWHPVGMYRCPFIAHRGQTEAHSDPRRMASVTGEGPYCRLLLEQLWAICGLDGGLQGEVGIITSTGWRRGGRAGFPIKSEVWFKAGRETAFLE